MGSGITQYDKLIKKAQQSLTQTNQHLPRRLVKNSHNACLQLQAVLVPNLIFQN